MAIRFSCQCGKSLKAREENAGRRTQCPQCGAPVGIPSLKPTHRGVSALPGSGSRRMQHASGAAEQFTSGQPAVIPETATRSKRPPQRRRQAVSSASPVVAQRGRAVVDVQIRRRSQPRWWRLCGKRGRLVDAVEFGSFNPIVSVGCLAVGLTVSVSVLVRLLPESLQLGWTALPHGPFFIGALFLMLVSLGYGCSWAGRILSFAATGKTQDFAFDLKLENALIGLARWLACFAAGPIVPAAAGLVYWTQCGAMAAIDWLILAEFAFVATAYWLALLTAVSAGRGIRSIIPTQVFALFRRLGLTGISITLMAVVLLLAVGTTMSFAAAKIHADEAVGFLLLGLCCVCGPLSLTLVLRRLGEEYYRTAALKDASTARANLDSLRELANLSDRTTVAKHT